MEQIEVKAMIITDKNYDLAIAKIDELWGAEPGTSDAMLLDLLFDAVEQYDSKIPHVETDAVDAILFRMDQKGWRQKDVAHLFGGESHTSEVLNRRRVMSYEIIKRVHVFMGIPIEDLIDKPGAAADTSEDYHDDRRGRKTELDHIPGLAAAA